MKRQALSLVRWITFLACVGLVLWLVNGPSLAQDDPSTEEPTISAPTDVPTDAPTDIPPTDIPTDTPTDAPTDTPTDMPTDTPVPTTETPTDVPTDTVIPTTEAPTDVTTEVAPTDTPTKTATTETATTEPTATALPAEPALQALAHESFDSGDFSHWRLDDGWTLTLVEGGLALRTNTTGSAEFISPALANVVVEARVQAGETVELILHRTETSAYTLSLSPDGQVTLRRNGDNWQTVSVEPSQPDQWRTLRLSVIDGVIRAAIDGVEVITVVDADPLPAGSVALAADVRDGGQVLVDDVRMSIPADEALPILTETATTEPTEAVTAEATVEPTQEATAEATLEPTPEVTESAPSGSALTLIFQDSFTKGAAADWQLADGWAVAVDDGNAVLRDVDSSGAASLSTIDRYSTVAQAQVRLDGGVARLSVRQGENGAYTAALGANDTLNLFRGDKLVAATGLDDVAGDWHTLRLSAIDGDVVVSFDDEDVIAWTDDDPLLPGSVEFNAQNASGLALDEVQVWVPSDTPMMTALLASPQSGNTYTVNTAASGTGSCPATCTWASAVSAANSHAGPDTIEFQIPGDGIHVINAPGVVVYDELVIDATTQSGYDGTPLIELRYAGNASEVGIRIQQNGSSGVSDFHVTVRGLAITQFLYSIQLNGGTGHLIESNYIGVQADNQFYRGNTTGIMIQSGNNTIKNNLIAGNSDAGGNTLNGNGIEVNSANGNLIVGNYIYDNRRGIYLSNSSNNTIGGSDSADWNIIVENAMEGIRLWQTSGTDILGNLIGIWSDAVTPYANDIGIVIQNSHDNVIGGTTGNEANVISGNTTAGISIIGDAGNTSSGNIIKLNLIGTDGSVENAVPNGAGILVDTVNGLSIGDNAYGSVISGNSSHGIQIKNSANIALQGNWIGLGADQVALPNHGNGLNISKSAGVQIGDYGGTTVGDHMNLISYNQPADSTGGIWVSADSTGIVLHGNSIHDNTGLGIDLASVGINSNDTGDGDTGANNKQNYPIVSFSVNDGTTFSGTLNSKPSTTYEIDFYANATCDSSGNGEGQSWFTHSSTTTNSTGNASFSTTISDLVPGGWYVTSIATDPNGNSSEFSKCVRTSDNLGVILTDSPDPTLPNSSLTYTAIVSNSGPSYGDNTIFTVTLPSSVAYVSAAPTTGAGTCGIAANVVTCQLGSVTSGTTVVVPIQVTVNPSASTSFTANASVTADTPDSNSANNTASQTTTLAQADLSITNSASPSPVTAGANLRYTLTVSNKGPTTAISPVLTNVLPATGVTYVTSGGATCTLDTLTLTCPLSDIAKNGSVTVTIEVTVALNAPANLSDTVSVTSAAKDTSTSNNSATTTTKVNQPPTPGNVTQTAPADKGATNDQTPAVNWTALTGGGSPFTYDVQFATNSTFTTSVQTVNISGNSASPTTDYAPGTIYWRVRALNVVSAPGAWSNARSLTIDITAPNAPTLSSPADGAQVSSTKPALSYSAPSGATRYRVDIATDDTFTTLMVTDGASSSTSFSPSTSLAQGQYYWRVQAGDAAGNWSDESTKRSFKVFIGTSPTDGAFVSTKPGFNWASVSGSTNYTVEISTNTDFTNIIRTQSSNKTSLTLSSALAGGTYYWRVRSSFDSSPLPSFPYRMMLVGTATAPTLTSPADKALVNAQTPTVQWSAVNLSGIAVAGYQVQTATDSKFSKNLITYPITSSTSQVLNSLSEGSVLFWRVKAIFGDSTSGPLSAARSFTVDITAPGIPSPTSPANNAQTSATRPTLSWSAPTGATQYQVDVASDSDFNTIEFTANPATTSITLTTSLPQGGHFWRVRARDAASNWSDFSSNVAQRAFYVFIGTAPADGMFFSDSALPTFTWAAVSGSAQYRLQIAHDNNFSDLAADVDSLTGTSDTLPSSLPTPGTYYWRVLSSFDVPNVNLPYHTLFVGVAPAAPSPNAPADKAVLLTSEPQVSWTAVTPPTGVVLAGYEVQVASDSAFTKGVQPVQGGTGFAATTVSLSAMPSGTYYWRVRAVYDFLSPGSWGTARSFTLNTTAPVLSSPSNNSSTTSKTPKLSWKSISGAVSYEVRIDTITPPGTVVTSPTTTGISFTPVTALSIGVHYWQVIAIDSAGNRSASAVWKFTVTAS